MAHVLELSDEQYQIVKEVAESEGRTPEDLFIAWVQDAELRAQPNHPTPARYETDDWLRHLGVSNEEIEASKQRVRNEAEMPYDANS